MTQLWDLDGGDLDAVVSTWLTTLGFAAVRVRERRGRMTTYQAVLGPPPLCTPVQVRVHQRRNRLQIQHLDSFIGHLTRTGIPAGLLITTGGCARDARLVAGAVQSPRVRLLSGDQWATELAAAHAGVRRCSLWRWIVDVNSLLCRSPRPPKQSPRSGR